MGYYRFPSLLFSRGGTDTTPDGRQAFLIIGDSNADGRGETIPTVPSNTLFKFNGSTFDEITTQSVANDDNTKGSSWQQMAIDYKAATGLRSCIIQRGLGGSEFYPNGDTNNWFTTGTLYAAAVTAANSALTALNISKLKCIIINLGINDIRSSNSDTNINAAVDSLISRLTADFPFTNIVFVIPGREEVSDTTKTSRAYFLRRYIAGKAATTDNVHVCCNAFSFTGSGMMNADLLHYTQAGYNALGSMMSRWLTNTAYSKWSRSVISSMFDDITLTRKGLMSTFIDSQVANGNYFRLEGLNLYKTSTLNNIFVDISFCGYVLNQGATFVTNSHIATDGSTSNLIASFTPSIYLGQSGRNDVIFGVKTKNVNTAAGVVAGLFGGTSTEIFRIAQSATKVNGAVNYTSTFDGTDANLQSNTLYSAARSGTSEFIIKNATIDATRVQASTGTFSGAIRIGCLITGGSATNRLNAQYEYSYASRYTLFDQADFYSKIETLMTNW